MGDHAQFYRQLVLLPVKEQAAGRKEYRAVRQYDNQHMDQLRRGGQRADPQLVPTKVGRKEHLRQYRKENRQNAQYQV